MGESERIRVKSMKLLTVDHFFITGKHETVFFTGLGQLVLKWAQAGSPINVKFHGIEYVLQLFRTLVIFFSLLPGLVKFADIAIVVKSRISEAAVRQDRRISFDIDILRLDQGP